MKSGGHGNVFCSVLRSSTCWRRHQYLTEWKEVGNDEEGGEVEVEEE